MQRGRRISEALLAKEKSDAHLLSVDKAEWYQVDRRQLSSLLDATFLQLSFDREAEEFLANSLSTSNSICLQTYYTLATLFLQTFITKTSINGVLDRGGMYLFSPQHFQQLLDLPPDWIAADKKMIDLGAGDGAITEVMKQYYKQASATEASQIMQWRLRQKDITLLPIDGWNDQHFDLISALNLLDRHFDPKSLLRDLRKTALDSNGIVLLAVVLPWSQYVEFNLNDTTSTRATDHITLDGSTFEQQANSLTEQLLIPAGFQVLRWTKLPYLCEGDSYRAYYKLTDSVFVLKAIP
uniref:Uncharacterized protein n=1 Tax=Plectus sambesii TaxID=2011161 RepID=A0A914WKH3_9BILA